MKLATFIYTDLKGKTSNRKVLITNPPSDKYSGLDVSELNDEDIALFATEYNKLQEEHINKLEELKKTYDLKNNYRQFFEKSMQYLETELL